MLKSICAALMSTSAVVLSAIPVQAQSVQMSIANENSLFQEIYNYQMAKKGFTAATATVESINAGRATCEALSLGVTPDQLILTNMRIVASYPVHMQPVLDQATHSATVAALIAFCPQYKSLFVVN